MRRLFRFGILGVLLVGGTTACFVRTERVVVASPSTCASAVWIEGHYEARGRWVPGYWRCQRTTY